MCADELLVSRWLELCSKLGLQGDCAGVGRDIVRRYSEPHRHYHNCEHLMDCLRVLDVHVAEAENVPAVEMALWFHDCVYVVGAKDNEQCSADLAGGSLRKLGGSQQLVDSVRTMILATRHDLAPPTDDARLVCDIDLSILGSSPERYDDYAGAILAESGLSLEKFRPLRIAFLEGMLARPHRFHTDAFRQELEALARSNMARELELLSSQQ